jgi:hypothetical protein
MNFRSINKQKGFSLIQTALAVAIGVAATAMSYNLYQRTYDTAQSNAAYEEVNLWLAQMTNIGSLNAHVYTGLDADDLIEQTSIESTTNVYGKTIALSVVTNNWQMAYPLPDMDACRYVLSRIANHPGLASTPTCATNTLTAVVE